MELGPPATLESKPRMGLGPSFDRWGNGGPEWPQGAPVPCGPGPRASLSGGPATSLGLPDAPLTAHSQPITSPLRPVKNSWWRTAVPSERGLRARQPRCEAAARVGANCGNTQGTKAPFRGTGTSGSDFWRASVSFISPSPGGALHSWQREMSWGWGGWGSPPGALLNSRKSPVHPAAAPTEKELGNLLSSSSCLKTSV